MKYLICLLLFLSFLSAQTAKAQDAKTIEYFGKLEAELSPEMKYVYGRLFKPAETLSKYKLDEKISAGAIVTASLFNDPRVEDGKIELLLIEPKESAAAFICSDFNSDARIETKECANLTPAKENPNDFEAVLRVPLETPLFKSYPIFVRYRKGVREGNMGVNDRLVMLSILVIATGSVNIGERKTRVEYNFKPMLKAISATDGWFGIDADGDGKVRSEPFSPETGYATKEEMVFRVGDLYVSNSSIDLEKNQIVLRRRAPEEYRRQDLTIGAEMPDFAFVDFEDKERKLSEFRGKYLLVDFWGLWCIDCRRELPFQLAAYKRFRAKGFEILGLDTDDEIAVVKGILAKNNLTWTQAKKKSIEELIEVKYRIQEYPSAILLGRDGKVITLDQKKLQGEELLKTLEQIFAQEK